MEKETEKTTSKKTATKASVKKKTTSKTTSKKTATKASVKKKTTNSPKANIDVKQNDYTSPDELIDEIDKETSVLEKDDIIERVSSKELINPEEEVIKDINEMLDNINPDEIEIETIPKEEIKPLKRESYKQKKPNALKNLLYLFLKILILSIFIYIIFTFVFGLKRLNAMNMNPNYKEGDLLLYYRLDNQYKENDAIVIEKNNKKYVVRLVAKPGQIVDIKDNLLIDGYPETEKTYFKTVKNDDANIKYPYQLKENEYFVINDNREDLEDSRSFGAITKDQIKGKIIGKIQIRNL